MFSLNEYVSYAGFNKTHTCPETSVEIDTTLMTLLWAPIVNPTVPLEKIFPFVFNRHTHTSIHHEISDDDKYKHFILVYHRIINDIADFINTIRQYPPSICLGSFKKSIESCGQKNQRLVFFTFSNLKTALRQLMSNDLFCYASQLRIFSQNRNVKILVFSNILRVQILYSIQSFIEQSPSVSKHDFLILPYSVKSKQRQNILVLEDRVFSKLQHCIFCDWVSDSSSNRKNSLLLSPFLVSTFDLDNLTIFSTIKTLLRWFCVSRSQYRGILHPGEPGFSMYKYLPRMLTSFNIRRELSKYHTRKLVSSTSKKIDNNTPNFLRGLKSFLQLKNEHFCDLKTIHTIHTFIHSKQCLQSVFPHVWDITNHILFKTKRKCKISLNDLFLLNGKSIPSYMFLYGMILHKSVPKKIKQMIWLNVYTTTPMILPSKLKGIEQMQRHTQLYKNYDTYVKYDKKERHCFKPNQEFLQLMVCLEYRSYMNPSKISFKVSNIPSIKLKTTPIAFPIVAKDRIKSSQDMDNNNYAFTNNTWVIRNIEYPESFRFKRDFLIDEIMFSKLFKSM